MFGRQRQLLAQADSKHSAAVKTRNSARRQLSRHKEQFLGEPLNLLYPFTAGILVCASQLKNEAKGLQRIPFLNLAKMVVGIWATTERIRKIRENQLTSDAVDEEPSDA